MSGINEEEKRSRWREPSEDELKKVGQVRKPGYQSILEHVENIRKYSLKDKQDTLFFRGQGDAFNAAIPSLYWVDWYISRMEKEPFFENVLNAINSIKEVYTNHFKKQKDHISDNLKKLTQNLADIKRVILFTLFDVENDKNSDETKKIENLCAHISWNLHQLKLRIKSEDGKGRTMGEPSEEMTSLYNKLKNKVEDLVESNDIKIKIKIKKIRDQWYSENEKQIFTMLEKHTHELEIDKLSHWGKLFYAQHYSFPTRLLDWSTSLAIALYFVVRDYKYDDTSLCLWILNPYQLNKKAALLDNEYGIPTPGVNFKDKSNQEIEYRSNFDDSIIKIRQKEPKEKFLEVPCALNPIIIDKRMSSQHSMFTLQGTDKRSLEEQLKDDMVDLNCSKNPSVFRRKTLFKYTIHPDQINDINKFVEYAGINEYTLMGTPESLAKVIKQRLKF